MSATELLCCAKPSADTAHRTWELWHSIPDGTIKGPISSIVSTQLTVSTMAATQVPIMPMDVTGARSVITDNSPVVYSKLSIPLAPSVGNNGKSGLT